MNQAVNTAFKPDKDAKIGNRTNQPADFIAFAEMAREFLPRIRFALFHSQLGMKQCKPNPWEEFARHFSKGDKVSGLIRSITDFGVFIGLEGGIDGLVHLSDLSWHEPGEEAVRKY